MGPTTQHHHNGKSLPQSRPNSSARTSTKYPDSRGAFSRPARTESWVSAPVYNKCAITTLAFSTASQCLIVDLNTRGGRLSACRKPLQAGGAERLRLMLSSPRLYKYGLKMDGIAASLYLDHGMRITHGVDCLSASPADRSSVEAIVKLLGFPSKTVLEETIAKSDEREGRVVALQACAMYRVATLHQNKALLEAVARIDTTTFTTKELDVLAKIHRDAERLRAAKPTLQRNDVDPTFKSLKGRLDVISTRYKTKVMISRTQTIMIQDGKNVIHGRAVQAKGKGATINLNSDGKLSKNAKFFTIGREAPTGAEAQRVQVILAGLQRANQILLHPFVEAIWQPFNKPVTPPTTPQIISSSINDLPGLQLNKTQTMAVNDILSEDVARQISMVHGPPGTGKSSVIAVSSMAAVRNPKKTIWIITQSNVAAKNVAEAFAKRVFFDFKLLVSEQFHFEWHEHIYSKELTENLIRSDEFPNNPLMAERALKGSRILLCTLSMLSNPRIAPFVVVAPVQTIIIDEASQIEVGGYIPVFSQYKHTLRKMVFVGDDKQLAPFGQEENRTLQSIFEFPHLRKEAIFLDTQYRMPLVVGAFISKHIYGGKLKTEHQLKNWECCRLFDVRRSQERKENNSWANDREVEEMIGIVRLYVALKREFRVITPYDLQRNLLEKALKTSNLPWEGICFCVDSFQGNEADHIILSLVKTEKLGFLTNLRRMNVALTRCKKSMVILTSRHFVEGVASSTLVGKMAKETGSKIWVSNVRELARS